MDMHDVEDISHIVMEELQQHGSFQLWNLTISGYDEDPRALFEIPEVRAWCKSAHAKAPYLPCLLSERAIKWYSSCVLEIEIVRRRKRSMGPEERSAMESVLRTLTETDSKAAEQMRQSLEWEADIRLKSPEETRFFVAEVGMAGYGFFLKQCGVKPEVAIALSAETHNRIARAITI